MDDMQYPELMTSSTRAQKQPSEQGTTWNMTTLKWRKLIRDFIFCIL